MPKYLSNRQQNLKIGVSSFTENQQVLDVTGNVGIKTSDTQGYELFVNGDANITGIVSASSFIGDGSQLTGIVASGSGISIESDGVLLGVASTINFDLGLDVSLTGFGGIATVTTSSVVSGISSIQVRYNDINIGTGSSILNFKGSGITSVTSSPIGVTTITVDLTGNLDGGVPNSNYGGIESIDAGGV
jgi:hypothetical protein